MPLKNLKHEAFAMMLIEGQKHGWTQRASYSRAGYSSEGNAAEAAASRLLKDVKNGIAARVQEIVGRGARRAEVTVESILGELEDARIGASTAAQFSAATAASVAKAKLKGLMTDRIEVGGAGAFEPTLERVAEAFACGGTAADALLNFESSIVEMRSYMEKNAAAEATMIAAPVVASRPISEASIAIGMLRPSREKTGR
jgi:hypothetical protein